MNLSKKRHKLTDEPIDYILSVHINNLVQTYGKDKVLGFINSVYNPPKKQTVKRSTLYAKRKTS